MVKGLGLFKEHFKDFTGSFVIIGGTACSLLLEGAGLVYRATKDIDIILYVETLEPRFGKTFWDFVKKAGYEHSQKSTGKKIFYRFFEPASRDYPEMLELFSSKPEGFELDGGSRLTPIPFNDEASSLSAILLDTDYYPFIQKGRKTLEGLPVLGPEYLIPLKAKAFLDLSARSQKDGRGDRKDIKKHRNDVFRLFPLLTGESKIQLPPSIAEDMWNFLNAASKEELDLKPFGIKSLNLQGVLENIKNIYGL
jgi:hypothetical protein